MGQGFRLIGFSLSSLKPSSPEALIGPPWRCSNPAWRSDVGAAVMAIQGLNRSQQRAILTAVFRTFTLWQVRCETVQRRCRRALSSRAATLRCSPVPGRPSEPWCASIPGAVQIRCRPPSRNITLGLQTLDLSGELEFQI